MKKNHWGNKFVITVIFLKRNNKGAPRPIPRTSLHVAPIFSTILHMAPSRQKLPLSRELERSNSDHSWRGKQKRQNRTAEICSIPKGEFRNLEHTQSQVFSIPSRGPIRFLQSHPLPIWISLLIHNPAWLIKTLTQNILFLFFFQYPLNVHYGDIHLI